MDLCLEVEWRPEARVSEKWYEQGCSDLVGAWAAAARAEEEISETGGGTLH